MRRSDDRRLERTAGSDARPAGAVRRRWRDAFEPDKALGFSGDIRYELRAADGTLQDVDGAHRAASRRPPCRARDGPAALTMRLALADFVRMAGRDLDPGKALLSGRLDLDGDFAVAARLGEMFGQPSAI